MSKYRRSSRYRCSSTFRPPCPLKKFSRCLPPQILNKRIPRRLYISTRNSLRLKILVALRKMLPKLSSAATSWKPGCAALIRGRIFTLIVYTLAQLALSKSRINILIAETQVVAESHRRCAQELSLERHSLADELASLFQDLVSSLSDVNRPPTLLEDIETLHRNLKELKSVKEYVQIIEHALNLRFVARIFTLALLLSYGS